MGLPSQAVVRSYIEFGWFPSLVADREGLYQLSVSREAHREENGGAMGSYSRKWYITEEMDRDAFAQWLVPSEMDVVMTQ